MYGKIQIVPFSCNLLPFFGYTASMPLFSRISPAINLGSLTQALKRKTEYRNEQELWLKVKKDQQQYKKTITELKGGENFLGESCFAA